ncbi:MAG TPA: nicotinamide riboside transporter PnuC [Bacteroidales bacterium]|nr:nicotinamide riboside transporter PnuC [Bacteroidales bacterium]HQJ81981.1 nicotinamide riboside transporter PnuC [Bacteroidales bacterium]
MGAVAGIVYVFLEIRQNIWLWPVGIVTASVYLWVFFTGRLYAEMSLQGYYLIISIIGWYWWGMRTGGKQPQGKLKVSRIRSGPAVILAIILIVVYTVIWFVLDRFTDSPVPEWDSFITSFSIIGTWMLARKIYEHWYLWIIANSAASVLFFSRGLYPTMLLYIIYLVMSFAGLKAWKKSFK